VFADFLYPRMTGGRPFVVWLNDGEQMREGVTAKYACLEMLVSESKSIKALQATP
jgi:hypothetical protein